MCGGIVLGVLCGGCTTTLATFSIQPTAIQQVELGDTMARVQEKLGEPREVLPDPSREERVIWIYGKTAQTTTALSGSLHPTPKQPFSVDLERQLEQVDSPSYLIVFIDGSVSQVIEQP